MNVFRAITVAMGLAFLNMAIPPACTGCMEYQWGYRPGLFEYEYQTTGVSPDGISYDAPDGWNVTRIDRQTREVETCLGVKVLRTSFVVKVATDWVPSCDGGQELLPVIVGAAGCLAKGEEPTASCPCRYRAGIQCPNVLVVTPSAYLFKDVLIRFVLGIDNPWSDAHHAVCASPTVTPT